MIGIEKCEMTTMINKVDTMTPRQNDLVIKNFLSSRNIRQINYLVIYLTVWKSTLKSYHGEKNFVKPHNKNLRNLILQMDDFLSLRGISG